MIIVFALFFSDYYCFCSLLLRLLLFLFSSSQIILIFFSSSQISTNEFIFLASTLGRTSTETLRVRCLLQLKRRAWNSHNPHFTVEHGFVNVTCCREIFFSAASNLGFRQLRSFESQFSIFKTRHKTRGLLSSLHSHKGGLSTFISPMQVFWGKIVQILNLVTFQKMFTYIFLSF